MAFNFRLNLQDAFRRLGIQSGARLPQLEDDVRMTMIVTDLSRLIPAPIEPRGLCGMNRQGSAPTHAVGQLQALSGGGIFIETVWMRGSGFTNVTNAFFDVSTLDLALPPGGQINIGGTATRSAFTEGLTIVGVIGIKMPAPEGTLTARFDVGMFVPNQSFFTVKMLGSNQRLDCSIAWRELPSIEQVG